MDVLYAQMQQGKKYDDSLLLVPGNIEEDRKFIDVAGSKNLLQLQCHNRPGIRVVALTGIQYYQRSVIKTGYDDGWQKGLADGREEGREEGRAEGAKDEKKATARRLLAMGLSAEQVTAATQLSLDEIKKL